jgi:sulfate adenylyltransferase subunit 2
MDNLTQLEQQSIYIIREAFRKVDRIAMLWSGGKDSQTILWLTRKAFLGHVPFPCVFMETSFDMPELIELRDRLASEWHLNLVIARNDDAIQAGMNHTMGRVTCCSALLKENLKKIVERENYGGLIVGVRRDEDPTRAKERYFSPRDQHMEWNVEDQPPELWDQFNTDMAGGTHLRVHPLLHWTEMNIWEYAEREDIPNVPLYFATEGQRYRSLGCLPCTFPIVSNANTYVQVREELRSTKKSERSVRAQDQESEDAFEKLRRDGYM